MMFLALLLAWMFSVGCCCNPCLVDANDWCIDHCNSLTSSETWQITFDNVENDACSECGDFNTTTFLLAQDAVFNCFWEWSGALPCDGEVSPMLRIEFAIGSPSTTYVINVINSHISIYEARTILTTLSGPRDCCLDTFTGEAIDDGVAVTHCKWSTASTPATFDAEAV